VYLMGVYLTGVHLMGVHLIGVYLMGVHLIDVYFMFDFPNPKRVLARSPILQTVVRWSICRNLSCKIRVFALVAGWSLLRAAPQPLQQK
jgi:hypothetical protein